MKSASTLILIAALCTGCYRVSVVSGLPETAGPPATNGATHGGFLEGIIEDDQIHAGLVCKGPMSSMYVETSFLNGLVNSIRGVIYHTQNVTVRCAAPPPGPAAPTPVVIDTSKYPPGSVVVVSPPGQAPK